MLAKKLELEWMYMKWSELGGTMAIYKSPACTLKIKNKKREKYIYSLGTGLRRHFWRATWADNFCGPR